MTSRTFIQEKYSFSELDACFCATITWQYPALQRLRFARLELPENMQLSAFGQNANFLKYVVRYLLPL